MRILRIIFRKLMPPLMVLCSCVASAATRPNIVFMLSDDHAVRAVSAYGNSIVATPNIDRIAAAGVRFNRAYVGNAICGPSRATLLTGLHSHANGFLSNEWSGPFNAHQQTLSSLLQASGYQTAVLAHLAAEVVSIERHAALAAGAAGRLRELGMAHVTVVVGDGSEGWPAAAPYDRILVTAGAPAIPDTLVAQLVPGGRLVIPVGPSPHLQTLVR